jgi:TRAP-type C4-dicarboxylate transport system permease small subunit
MRQRIEQVLGIAFGFIFLGLAVVVTVETASRKLFNVSLQGADELGGYALAVGATLGFSLALLGRAHIRVDVFHDRLPRPLQLLLNWLSVVSLAALAMLMAYLAWFVIQDSRAYQSVAQTPWATPLVYPQTAWLIGLGVFGVVALFSALRATWLLLRGDYDRLQKDYGPRSTKEEVDEELEDIKARGVAEPGR